MSQPLTPEKIHMYFNHWSAFLSGPLPPELDRDLTFYLESILPTLPKSPTELHTAAVYFALCRKHGIDARRLFDTPLKKLMRIQRTIQAESLFSHPLFGIRHRWPEHEIYEPLQKLTTALHLSPESQAIIAATAPEYMDVPPIYAVAIAAHMHLMANKIRLAEIGHILDLNPIKIGRMKYRGPRRPKSKPKLKPPIQPSVPALEGAFPIPIIPINEWERQKLAECHQAAARHGGRCLSTHFLGAKKKLEWECQAGHRWWAPASNILCGHWCSICFYTNQAANYINEIRTLVEAQGGKIITIEKKNHSRTFICECRAGHRQKIMGAAIKAGKWCVPCHRLQANNPPLPSPEQNITLPIPETPAPNSLTDTILRFMNANPEWMSIRRIAEQCGASPAEIRPYLLTLLNQHCIDMRIDAGTNKKWYRIHIAV